MGEKTKRPGQSLEKTSIFGLGGRLKEAVRMPRGKQEYEEKALG